MLADVRSVSLCYTDTVVTSFPRKWTQPNGDHVNDILDRLLHHLRSDKTRRPIESCYDLAQLIVRFCTNVFDRSTSSTQLHLRELFECSIGAAVGTPSLRYSRFLLSDEQADSEVKLLKTFREACVPEDVEAGKLAKANARMTKLEAISNIDPEIKLLREIKDIQDELRMIMRIFNDQAVVRTEFTDLMEDYRQNFESQKPQAPTMPAPAQEPQVSIEAQPNCLTVRSRTMTEDGGVAEGGHQKRLPEPYSNIRDFRKLLEDAGAVHNAVWDTSSSVLFNANREAQLSPGFEAKASKYHGSKICT